MSQITQFLLDHGGPVLFLAVLVEQIGLPLPAAPWLLAAGTLAAVGGLDPLLAIGLSVLACLIADSIWFWLGRRGGERVLGLFCRLSLAQVSCVGRTEGLFAKHGMLGVLAAKFLPGLGAVMPPLAGAFGVSAGRFLFFDGLGSLLYAGAYVVAGLVFSQQVEQVLAVLSRLGLGALGVMLALVAGYAGFKYLRRRETRRESIQLEKAAIPEVVAPSLQPTSLL